MVPSAPPVNRTASAPGWALASRIACRNEPAPLSLVFVTRKLLRSVRFSSDSKTGRYGCEGAPSFRSRIRALNQRSVRAMVRPLLQSFCARLAPRQVAAALVADHGYRPTRGRATDEIRRCSEIRV